MPKRKRAHQDTIASIFGAKKPAEPKVAKPVEKAQPILTPKKPKVKKVRVRHVRPPKRTPLPPRAEPEGPKTGKARTLTQAVAKLIPKADVKPEPK